jgi:hypothetical protein
MSRICSDVRVEAMAHDVGPGKTLMFLAEA